MKIYLEDSQPHHIDLSLTMVRITSKLIHGVFAMRVVGIADDGAGLERVQSSPSPAGPITRIC